MKTRKRILYKAFSIFMAVVLFGTTAIIDVRADEIIPSSTTVDSTDTGNPGGGSNDGQTGDMNGSGDDTNRDNGTTDGNDTNGSSDSNSGGENSNDPSTDPSGNPEDGSGDNGTSSGDASETGDDTKDDDNTEDDENSSDPSDKDEDSEDEESDKDDSEKDTDEEDENIDPDSDKDPLKNKEGKKTGKTGEDGKEEIVAIKNNEIKDNDVGNPVEYVNNSYTDANGNYIFDVSICDLIVTIKGGSESDVAYGGGGQYSDKDNNQIQESPGVLYINSCKPVTIRMRDGVESTPTRIEVTYSEHGAFDCAFITLDNVKIDRSNYVPFIQAVERDYLDSSTGENGRGTFSAFAYLGGSTEYSSVTLTLVGENELIGPDIGYCGLGGEEKCYGMYIKGGRGIGIKGDGSLKVRGGDGGIRVVYGIPRIEEGYYDIQSIEMDENKCAIITGGCFAEGDVPSGSVYGCYASRARYGPSQIPMYTVTYNQDDATKTAYPYRATMTDQASEYLAPYIGRQILYDMDVEYGRAYDAVYAAAVEFEGGSTFEAKYVINNGFSQNETQMIQRAVENDHPEFMWWWNAQWGGWSRGVVINLGNPLTSLELSKRKTEFADAADELFREAGITDSMSDFQKAYELYQVMIKHVVYDLSAGDQSAYEAVVQGKAVCAGYAKAYVYLLQKAGIKASYVPGQAIPPGGNRSEGHAWVLLNIDGNYYHSDPTWDDGGTTSRYRYFNLPWSALSSDHFIDDDLYYSFPSATSPQRGEPSGTVTVSATSTSGGRVYPSSLKVPANGSVKVSIIPEYGNNISEIKVNGTDRSTDELTDEGNNCYSFVLDNVTTAQNIKVSFGENTIEPDKVTVGDFVLYATYGGELTTDDYLDCGSFLQLTTDKPITIEMAEGVDKTTQYIRAQKNGGGTINLTIKDIDIEITEHSSYENFIDAKNNSLNLTLVGNNILKGPFDSYTDGYADGITVGKGSTNYGTNGDLVINGTGSLDISGMGTGITLTGFTLKSGTLNIHDCYNAFSGFRADYIRVSGGRFSIKDCHEAFYDWQYDYQSYYPEISITGGMFSSGNISAKTVLGLPISYPGASGCKVVSSGDADYPFKVTGGALIKTASITLNSTSATMFVGAKDADGLILRAKVKPDDVSDPGLVWSSSNTNIATVEDNGDGTATVTAVSKGNVNITVKATDGSNKSATCKVTVLASPVRVRGTDLSDEVFNTLSEARAYIDTGLSADTTGELTYFVTLNDNVTIESDELDFGALYNKITLDLNGFRISMPQGGTSTASADAYIAVKEIKGGTFCLSSYSDAHIGTSIPDTAITTTLENLTFVKEAKTTVSATVTIGNRYDGYKATVTGSSVSPGSVDVSIENCTATLDELVSSGNVSVEAGAALTTGVLSVGAGIFKNAGTTEATSVTAVKTLDNMPQGLLKVESLTTASTSALYLEPDSILHVTKTATLNNIYLGQDIKGQASVKSSPDSMATLSRSATMGDNAISINGKVVAKDQTDMLKICTKTDPSDAAVQTTPGGCILFSTNIKTFPTDMIEVDQPAESKKYTTLLQIGSNVIIATDWIELYAGTEADHSKDQLLVTFAKWSEAVAYVNTISSPGMHYTIILNGNVTTCENLSFPSSAKSFTIKGSDPDAPSELVFLGNITLTTDTVFENLNLRAQSYNSKTNTFSENSASVVNLNGKRFEIVNTRFVNPLGSLTGKGNSGLVLIGAKRNLDGTFTNVSTPTKMKLDVTGAVSMAYLESDNYDVCSTNNAVSVSGQTYLKSTVLECATDMTLGDVHTLDGNNQLIYALNAKNKLKINGTVDSISKSGSDTGSDADLYMVDGTGTVIENAAGKPITTKVNKNAIEIKVKYIVNAAQGTSAYVLPEFVSKALITAPKGAANYFVIERGTAEYNLEPVGTIRFATKKKGNDILVMSTEETVDTAVVLKGKKQLTQFEGDYSTQVVLGRFFTLQEALNEINAIGDPTGEYIIEMDATASTMDDVSDTKSTGKVTKDNVNLTIPKNASKITITNMTEYDDGGVPLAVQPKAVIYTKDTLTLNTNLILDNISIEDKPVYNKAGIFAGYTRLNVNLGGYSLTLNGSDIGDNRMGNVSGNGVGKGSRLKLVYGKYDGTETLNVNGNLKDVGTLEADGIRINVSGPVNVGSVINIGSTLVGTAAVKTSVKTETIDSVKGKRTYVDGVNPNITIAGTVVNNEVSGEKRLLTVCLTCNGEEINETYLKGIMTSSGHSADSASAVYDTLLSGNAYHVVKAPSAETTEIMYAGVTASGFSTSDPHLAKNSGFICYSKACSNYSLYRKKADGLGNITEEKLSDFVTFAETVAEIENRNDITADYVVKTTGNANNVAETFAMPSSKKLKSLTIRGVKADGSPVDEGISIPLYYGTVKGTAITTVSKLALSTNTVMEDITFRDASDAAVPLTFALGGYSLTADGLSFAGKAGTPGRALLIDGGKKGVLEILGNHGLYTVNDSHDDINYMEGAISSLDQLVLEPGTTLYADCYVSAVNAKGVKTIKPGSVAVNSASLNGNTIRTADVPDATGLGRSANAAIAMGTVTMADGSNLISCGTIAVTDLTATGSSPMLIRADRDISIKGNLVLDTDKLSIETRRKKDVDAKTAVNAIEPYLNISGTVTSNAEAYKAAVTMYPYNVNKLSDTDTTPNTPITLSEGEMAKLLISPKGTIHNFSTGNQPSTLVKMGNYIYAANRSSVNVALIRTSASDEVILDTDLNAWVVTQGNDNSLIKTAIDVYGYYPTVADAVTAINSVAFGKNDPRPSYVMVLLNDVGLVKDPGGDVVNPITLTLPKATQLSGLAIASNGEIKETGGVSSLTSLHKTMCYSNNITLTSDLCIRDVILAPTAVKTVKKARSYSAGRLNFTVGNYMLTFDHSTNDPDGNDVVGYWYDENGLTASVGNIAAGKTGGLTLEGTNMKISGNLSVPILNLTGSSTLDITGPKTAHSIGNIDNSGSGTIRFNRGALTITGTITNNTADELLICVNAGSEDCVVRTDLVRVDNSKLFAANKKLFTAGCISAGYQGLNDVEKPDALITIEDDGYASGGNIVKVGNDFYYAEDILLDNMVVMDRLVSVYDEVAETYVSEPESARYLDVNSALAQIGSWADPNGSYVIHVDNEILDVNIRDKFAHSAIAMPANNKAGRIIFDGDGSGSLLYSGAITAYAGFTTETGNDDGGLTFKDITLCPVAASDNKAGDIVAAAGNINLYRNGNDKAGSPDMRFEGVTIGGSASVTGDCFIAGLSGTKSFTDVCTDSDLILTGGFSNVRNVTVDGATVVTGGNSGAMNNVIMKGTSPCLVATAAMAIDNLMIDDGFYDSEGHFSGTVSLGTKTKGSDNNFTIRNTVTRLDGETAPSDTKIEIISINNIKGVNYLNYGEHLFDQDEQVGKNLVIAAKAYAGFFSGPDGSVSYKLGTGVYNGPLSEMRERIVWTEGDGAEHTYGYTYARSYTEAVATINTQATCRDYEIRLLRQSTTSAPEKTAGKVGSPDIGAIAFPAYKNASSVRIVGEADDAVIGFTGALTPGTYVTFDNVTLTSGTYKKGIFTPDNKVSAAMTSGYDLTFDVNANTPFIDANTPDVTGIAFGKVTGNKGVIIVRYGNPVKEKRFIGSAAAGSTDSENMLVKVEYDGQIVYVSTWADAVGYINARNNKQTEYTLTLLDDLGSPDAPISGFTVPAAAKLITVKDNDPVDSDHVVYFVGNALGIQTNVILDDIALSAYSYNKKTKVYSSVPYNISIGNNVSLTMMGDSLGHGAGTSDDYDGIGQISGGTLSLEGKIDTSNPMSVKVAKIVNVRSLKLKDAILNTEAGNLTASVDADLSGGMLNVNGLATIKNGMLVDSEVRAYNLNMTGNLTMSDSIMDAGLSGAVGNGKVTVANLKVIKTGEWGTSNANTTEIITKQDNKGNSQFALSGTVTVSEFVDVLDENGVPVTDGSGNVLKEEKTVTETTYEKAGETKNISPVHIRVLYNNRTTEAMSSFDKAVQTNAVGYTGMVYATFANNTKASQYAPYFEGIYTDAITASTAATPEAREAAKNKAVIITWPGGKSKQLVME